MSSTSRVWTVAASLGAMEAMKNQGICRWSNTLRSLQQHPKNSVRSYSLAKRLSAPVHSLRKVMHLSCWGPN
ncbi:hypothetical protein ACJW30_01G363800 [Castanea mollissima]